MAIIPAHVAALVLPQNLPSPLRGSVDSFRTGSKKRRLDPVVVGTIAAGATAGVDKTYNLTLKGLTSDLTVIVAAGVTSPNALYRPSQYPSTPGTIQLFPKTNYPGQPILLRQVFQDPTATDNHNNPLAQDIPFGWTFNPGGVDEAMIDLFVPWSAYAGADVVGSMVVQATIEYTGSQLNINSDNDRKAIEWVLGQVQITGGPDVPTVLAP